MRSDTTCPVKTETGSQAYIHYSTIHNPDDEMMKETAQVYSVIINTVKQRCQTRKMSIKEHRMLTLAVVGHIQIGFLCEPAG